MCVIVIGSATAELKSDCLCEQKIKPIMKSYNRFKLEFQAIYWVITKKFHDYLMDHEFEFLTDSNPLARVIKSKRTATDMSKLTTLSSYQFNIMYKSGKSNRNADALSRYLVELSSEDNDDVNISHEA